MSSNTNRTMLVSVTQDTSKLTNFEQKNESYANFKNNTIANNKVNYSNKQNYMNIGNPFLSLSSNIFREIDILQNSYEIGTVEEVRTSLIEKIDYYTNVISSKDIENSQIMLSKYILCTFSDELITSTYWGKDNNWANNSLLGYFYNETYGGDKFFQILDQLLRSPAQYIHLLELLYICISLGFEGKYRIQNKGRMELDAIRDNLFRQIKMINGHESKPFYTAQKISKQQNRFIYKTSYQILALGIFLILSLVYGVLTFSLVGKEDTFMDLLKEKHLKYKTEPIVMPIEKIDLESNIKESSIDEDMELEPATDETTSKVLQDAAIKDLNE
jgi:type VI secretion system protein ImpK